MRSMSACFSGGSPLVKRENVATPNCAFVFLFTFMICWLTRGFDFHLLPTKMYGGFFVTLGKMTFQEG